MCKSVSINVHGNNQQFVIYVTMVTILKQTPNQHFIEDVNTTNLLLTTC